MSTTSSANTFDFSVIKIRSDVLKSRGIAHTLEIPEPAADQMFCRAVIYVEIGGVPQWLAYQVAKRGEPRVMFTWNNYLRRQLGI